MSGRLVDARKGLQPPGRRETERGVALLAVLLAMTLVGALGTGLALLAATERQVAAHFAAGLDALYAAEAGAGRAAEDLLAAGDWAPIATGAARSSFVDGDPGLRPAPDGTSIDLAALTHLERCGRRVACEDADAVRPWRLYAHAPIRALLGPGRIASRAYVVVWVAPEGTGHDVLAVRARAFGPFGARRGVEVLVARSGSGIRVLGWREL